MPRQPLAHRRLHLEQALQHSEPPAAQLLAQHLSELPSPPPVSALEQPPVLVPLAQAHQPQHSEQHLLPHLVKLQHLPLAHPPQHLGKVLQHLAKLLPARLLLAKLQLLARSLRALVLAHLLQVDLVHLQEEVVGPGLLHGERLKKRILPVPALEVLSTITPSPVCQNTLENA